MSDTERQTAGGKVLWHFTMSLDGFVAVPTAPTHLSTKQSHDLDLDPVRILEEDGVGPSPCPGSAIQHRNSTPYEDRRQRIHLLLRRHGERQMVHPHALAVIRRIQVLWFSLEQEDGALVVGPAPSGRRLRELPIAERCQES